MKTIKNFKLKVFSIIFSISFVLSACGVSKLNKIEQKKAEVTKNISGEINVFSAVSMKNALEEIKINFEKKISWSKN